MHQASKERTVRYRQKLMDRAASILSPKQLDILRRDSEQRAANMERAWEHQRSWGKLVQTDENGHLARARNFVRPAARYPQQAAFAHDPNATVKAALAQAQPVRTHAA